jgi:hypothetical protein
MNGKTSLVCQRLLAATLLVGGLNTWVAPAFADGTAAGTSIDNTATATYDNPDDPTKPFNATSNTVKVTVAEVAGVTVTGLSTIDVNGGTVLPGDVVNFEFKVKNVGNDTTEFYIPSTTTVSGPGTATIVQVAGYIDALGNRVNFTPVTVQSGVTKTSDITGLPQIPNPAGGFYPIGVIPAGYSLVVNVPTTVNSGANGAASGSIVSVRLGDTGTAHDNGSGTQNQLDGTNVNPADNGEVRTVDYTGETGGSAGPVAQEKEAEFFQTVIVGSTSQALATILKNRTSYDPKVLTTLNDDVIGYSLALKVESTAPAGSTGITPGKLVGTDIVLDSGAGATTVNRVLVSDAIPVQTKLTSAGDVTVPNANWTPVYTDDTLADFPATKAVWSTTFDPNATRIGFIYNATTTPLAEGANITGFGFKVVSSGVAAGTTTVNVLNIAQVFGQTQGNEGPNAPLVYDESGDAMPSNFNDNGTPGSTATLTPSSPLGNLPIGKPDATNDGIDNGNDNTGQGPGGEDNVTTIALAGSILNGPSGFPTAVGPNDNNDDFTNRSTPVPDNITPGTLASPAVLPVTASVSFTNTLGNPSPIDPLTNVLIVPDLAAFTAKPGEALPPANTLVTLTYGGSTAVYEYIPTAGPGYPNGNFVFKSGSPIIVPTLAPNQTINYTVKVDLPANTPLSTDTEKGYSIPIYAFVDQNGDSRPATDGSEPTQNRTIDRVYTGFLKLVKEARVLDTDGATKVNGQDWTTDSSKLANLGAAGRFIEYRISYKNISIAPTGTGNTTLDAKNVAITEDGATGSNSWAKDSDTNGIIDTSHSLGSVSVTYGGPSSVVYSPSGEQTGTTATTDVTKYVHKPGVIIQPQNTGTFIFRRKIN